MKKTSLFLLLMALSLVAVRCGDSDQDKELTDEELYEFQGFSMKPYDVPIMIMLPDETANIGASTQPEIIHVEDDFKWELMVGPNFHMIIDDWGSDREMVSFEKKRLSGLNFYKINYLVDEPDFIMYERELKVDGKKGAPSSVGVEHKTYHVYGQKVIDDITYVFRSRDDGFEKIIIDLMAKSIKSVKPLKGNS
ncbi:hypothetical protein [Fluviicola taffensis]|uniref:Lipoprotein n=1 Tax=Fluviicola taffensis (strain DSM 16823 / NCIMB 13979 / RW262) TaxID=755732 RepID=F2IK33_FLUTR|nr:hypothetical protein [Fluviicola taffensis]AEA42932.1 hypothetical protein Fluta_0931 [Fluviicola taffensis DSM 16823]